MIVRHGFKSVLISKLKLPGDIEKRKKLPHVLELAKSYTGTGGQPAEPVIVEHMTWRLLAGRDRVTAAIMADLKELDALMVSGTEQELEALTLIENAHRRHSGQEKDAALARLVELRLGSVRDNTLLSREASPTKREAIAGVAKEVGRTPAAVRQAVHRAKAPKDGATPQPEVEVAPAVTLVIDSMGLVIPGDIVEQTAREHQGLEGIHRKLVELQSCLTRFEGDVGHQYQLLRQSLHETAVAARSSMPKSVCPWCKLTSRRKGCPGCRGRGWLTTGEMKACTDERLLDAENPGIWTDNKFVLLGDVR